jgi:RNA polymerase sigma-70 factor (ECF subfamily)
MASSNDESNLVSAAVSGNVAALEKLLTLHRRRLVAYVDSRFPEQLRDSIEPQDIVQDTWLRAVRGISEFQPSGEDPVFRWLVTIARNLIADQLKYRRASKRKGVRLVTEEDGEDASVIRLLEEMAVYRRTPSKSAASHELMAALDSAIGRLPADQGEALRLRYLAGLDVQEIAQKMSRSEGAISMLCNRALKSLRLEMRSLSLYL